MRALPHGVRCCRSLGHAAVCAGSSPRVPGRPWAAHPSPHPALAAALPHPMQPPEQLWPTEGARLHGWAAAQGQLGNRLVAASGGPSARGARPSQRAVACCGLMCSGPPMLQGHGGCARTAPCRPHNPPLAPPRSPPPHPPAGAHSSHPLPTRSTHQDEEEAEDRVFLGGFDRIERRTVARARQDNAKKYLQCEPRCRGAAPRPPTRGLQGTGQRQAAAPGMGPGGGCRSGGGRSSGHVPCPHVAGRGASRCMRLHSQQACARHAHHPTTAPPFLNHPRPASQMSALRWQWPLAPPS